MTSDGDTYFNATEPHGPTNFTTQKNCLGKVPLICPLRI